ncbi:hypothetical protein PVOR_24349 [Paenibacillus vortex V453]|uniref:Uncharacterized protein n=2 Tax=Paenibacillus TaxID=44249 RepID=A0A163ETV1_9BACL|nr:MULTISPECIES: hypothetical protein [Paenibacillus]ANA78610.1 hypothetical protein A3958_00745 [Paenibacillus glucanolyticus]AVV57475.1 hypothetical protein C7121_15810 [Paenibacillus glucanolyticus]AWP26632.1 hypothetical protein B9D94_08390 [Paenibacillus sp. Cedars]EFU39467.1 hypothetical protein PVOR_24349 [Paenibacillus vortex V453]ETT34909.1 hypothetical protein C169_17762 [Paenibacillus sp. FSL R5-808]
MKKVRLLVFSVAVLLIGIGLVWYYVYPIKIQEVMRHTNKIEKMDFVSISEGESNHYSIAFHEQDNTNELIDILDAVTYSRELNHYKGSTDRVIMMIIFYRNRDGEISNYSFDINESGIIISHHKQYQMNGDTRRVFDRLSGWIENKGTYIRVQ